MCSFVPSLARVVSRCHSFRISTHFGLTVCNATQRRVCARHHCTGGGASGRMKSALKRGTGRGAASAPIAGGGVATTSAVVALKLPGAAAGVLAAPMPPVPSLIPPAPRATWGMLVPHPQYPSSLRFPPVWLSRDETRLGRAPLRAQAHGDACPIGHAEQVTICRRSCSISFWLWWSSAA